MLERESSSVKILLSNMYMESWSSSSSQLLLIFFSTSFASLMIHIYSEGEQDTTVQGKWIFQRLTFSKPLCLLPPFPRDSRKSLFTAIHSLPRQQDFLSICPWIVNITFYNHRAYTLTANHFKATFPHIFSFPLKFSNEKIPILKNSLVQSNYVSPYVVRLQIISL